MADTRKPRRVGPLPWQAKLRMARNDRQQDAIAEARRPRSITYRFLEDAEDRVFVDPGTPAAPSTAGAERTGSAIERAQAWAALAPFERGATAVSRRGIPR